MPISHGIDQISRGVSLSGLADARQLAANARLLDWNDQSDFPGAHQPTRRPGGQSTIGDISDRRLHRNLLQWQWPPT